MEGCQGGKKKDNELKSIKIELESLVCDGSYNDLELSLPKVAGIADVDIDRDLKAAFIDYDPEIITEEAIVDAIAEVGCRIQEF